MSGLISDLMTYTRSRLGGGIPIALGPCDLRRLCEEALDGARVSHPERQFIGRLGADLVIQADPARMEQVLANLLFNAAQHGEPGTPITLVARGGPNGVELSVANEGKPIADETMATIFEPFVRGSDADDVDPSARSKTSLGLGLFIVREIVRGHDGTVDVDSTAEDGTIFTVRMPAARSPAA